MKQTFVKEKILFSSARSPARSVTEKKWGKKATMLSRGYFLTLCAVITGLYLYILITNILSKNLEAITTSIVCGFAVFVFDLVIVLSVFGLWKWFMQKFGRFGGVRYDVDREAQQRETLEQIDALEKRLSALDKMLGDDDEFYIYADCVNIVKRGEGEDIPLGELRKVTITPMGENCFVEIEVHRRTYYCIIPKKRGMLKTFRKLLPCPVELDKGKRDEKERTPLSERIDPGSIAGVVMGLIAMGAGSAVIAVHYCVEAKIPVFLGVFFIFGGLLVLCGILGHASPWCNEVLIPVLFGCAFIGFTWGFTGFMMEDNGITTLLAVLRAYPYILAMFGLAGVGVYFILGAIGNAVWLIKNRS